MSIHFLKFLSRVSITQSSAKKHAELTLRGWIKRGKCSAISIYSCRRAPKVMNESTHIYNLLNPKKIILWNFIRQFLLRAEIDAFDTFNGEMLGVWASQVVIADNSHLSITVKYRTYKLCVSKQVILRWGVDKAKN